MMQTKTVRTVTFGEGTPNIAIPITAKKEEELTCQLAALQGESYDLVEWRIDFYEPLCVETGWEAALEKALQVIRSAIGDAPLLVTFRTKAEGGVWEPSYEAYSAFCLAAAAHKEVDLIDVQEEMTRSHEESLIAKLQQAGKLVVASFHDFAGTPETEEILRHLINMQKSGADLTKIAVMPQSASDVIRLLDASVQMKERFADRPYITMSMGKLGQVTRAALSLTGGCLSFATAGVASAPGQMPAGELKDMLQLLDRSGETFYDVKK